MITSKLLLSAILNTAHNTENEPEDGAAESDLQEALEVALNHVPAESLLSVKKELEQRWSAPICENQEPATALDETFDTRNVSVRCEWRSYGYIHVSASSFTEAAEKVKAMNTLPEEINPIDGSLNVTVDKDDNLFE